MFYAPEDFTSKPRINDPVTPRSSTSHQEVKDKKPMPVAKIQRGICMQDSEFIMARFEKVLSSNLQIAYRSILQEKSFFGWGEGYYLRSTYTDINKDMTRIHKYG